MRTEISAKFRREGIEAELAAAGFEAVRWMTDGAGDFALSLSVRRSGFPPHAPLATPAAAGEWIGGRHRPQRSR